MTLKHLKAAPLYYKPIFTKNSKGMSRIMTARIILAMMCFLCFGLKADASARSENGKETDSTRRMEQSALTGFQKSSTGTEHPYLILTI